MTLGELRRRIGKTAGKTDAFAIIRIITGMDTAMQLAHAYDEADASVIAKAEILAEKRSSGIPLAYIEGKKEFYGHDFEVSPAVLIPRPDTETLVDTAIELASLFHNPRILDLCTGSGAIAASVAASLSLPVSFSDISSDALETAEKNYRKITGMDGDGRLGNLFCPWQGECFDIILSNPPYLTEKWYDETDKDIKSEPVDAFLGGGEDGLDIIREIIVQSGKYLKEGGALALECDYRQIGSCAKMLSFMGFTEISVKKDLAGLDRVIYGRRFSK